MKQLTFTVSLPECGPTSKEQMFRVLEEEFVGPLSDLCLCVGGMNGGPGDLWIAGRHTDYFCVQFAGRQKSPRILYVFFHSNGKAEWDTEGENVQMTWPEAMAKLVDFFEEQGKNQETFANVVMAKLAEVGKLLKS